jgi:ectoine hydroxylase-related dioxygenase (phytanoyl-CoA dioxygenase family)
MDIDAALAAFGADANTLTDAPRAALDQDGYLLVPEVLPRVQVAEIRDRMDEISAVEGENAGKDFHQENGVIRLGNLMNKGAMFDVVYTHPLALAAIRYACRGEFGVSSVTGRVARPGQGLQGFHCDYANDRRESAPGVYTADQLRGANVLWLIDEFTADNGPTRVIPGSHRIRGCGPGDVIADATATHPKERLVIAPEGSMLCIDSRLWHAGTRNNTDRLRRMANAMCQPRTDYQQWFPRYVTPEAVERVGAAGRYILDHPVREVAALQSVPA